MISPLLANIVLHYVLDEWFAKEVRPRLKGEAFLIRYADDFVIGVAREDDARRIMEVLPKRMSKYGLTVHPEKTRVVRFHPADVADSEPADQNSTGPRTFDFLGFTHYWGRSLKGGWVVKRKTAKSRLKRALHSLSDWCRQQPAPTDRRSNTRRSSRSCKATTRTMGSPVTSPVSRSSWRKRERSGDTGCRGAAAMARSPGRTSFDWSNVTAYPDREWSTACCAAQRSHKMRNRVRVMCKPGSVGGATRSYGCTCYDWSYDQDVTQCATTDTLPRRAAGVTWRCEALGTT